MIVFVIFRQDRFIGRAEAPTALEALDLWIDTYKCPPPPGPYMAIEENEAKQRKLIP